MPKVSCSMLEEHPTAKSVAQISPSTRWAGSCARLEARAPTSSRREDTDCGLCFRAHDARVPGLCLRAHDARGPDDGHCELCLRAHAVRVPEGGHCGLHHCHTRGRNDGGTWSLSRDKGVTMATPASGDEGATQAIPALHSDSRPISISRCEFPTRRQRLRAVVFSRRRPLRVVSHGTSNWQTLGGSRRNMP